MTNLKHYSHKIGVNFWHIEFGTKYRYKMFGKFKQKNIAEASIRKVCSRHNIKIHTIFVMPEHVHMMVTLPRNITESKGMQLIKGGSAYLFFRNPSEEQIKAFSRTFMECWRVCATTVGYNEYSTVEKYIQSQAEHHALA